MKKISADTKKKIKKAITWAGIAAGIAAGAAAIYGAVKILGNQNDSGNEFGSMSDDELGILRETERLKHCSGDENATRFMERIDKEIYRRESIGHENDEPWHPPHREHGNNLYKDD